MLRANGKNQTEEDSDEVRWWVPVSLITNSSSGQAQGQGQSRGQGEGQAVAWFNSNMTLPDPSQPSEWLLINIQAAGENNIEL